MPILLRLLLGLTVMSGVLFGSAGRVDLPFVWGFVGGETGAADFASYYYAAEHALDGGNPYDTAALNALAERVGRGLGAGDCELLALGTVGRRSAGGRIGNTARRIAAGATCSVMVMRCEGLRHRPVIVLYEVAVRALAMAAELADMHRCPLEPAGCSRPNVAPVGVWTDETRTSRPERLSTQYDSSSKAPG